MARWGALVAAVLLAGCLASSADPRADDAPAARVGFFASPMTLAAAPQNESAAVRTGSFFQAWAEGVDYPTWLADPPARDVFVDEVVLTLYVRATGPVTVTGRFPDIMAYAGSGDAWLGFASTQTDPVLLPGDVHRFELALDVPAGGLWVPPGEPFGVKIVPVMTQGEHNDVEILLGGDTPSQIAWRERPVALEARELQRGEDAGEVAGSAYAGPAAPATTSRATSLSLTEPPQRILAWMNTTDHAGIPDLDFALVGPDGEVVASAGTPTPREAIRVAAPNGLPAGEYRLVVTSYGSARASFTVEWLAG